MKDETPESRLGVYERIEDVPPHHRLSKGRNVENYRGRDVWAEYMDATDLSERSARGAAADHWNDLMADRGTHHALAERDDAAAWGVYLRENFAPTTAQDYWATIYRFYNWLLWHTEYPHRYNPLLLAACNNDEARRIWTWYVMPDAEVPRAGEVEA